jgi:hypothetical protein
VRRRKTKSAQKGEEGIVILLVAVVLLFIVAAMAALAIDVVTFYTARSEAQLAADGAALAGARVLANSGMTSDALNTSLSDAAKPIAEAVAMQVASSNSVGGRNLNGGTTNCSQEICVSFNDGDPSFGTNPRVTVLVTRADLPTFFARIWGNTTATVRATATAEAYNPSGADALNPPATPIAPTCVKPWVLPNMATAATKIFDENTGAILDATLIGQSANGGNGGLEVTCTNCSGAPPVAAHEWRYFPGSDTSFPVPTSALSSCSVGFTDFQKRVAGCVQRPISCGDNTVPNSNVDLDTGSTATNADAEVAVDCLTHAQNNFGDKIDPLWSSGQPFQYVGGNDNPVAGAQGANVMVSDSLVTVPVVDVGPGANFPATNPVKVIGFVQFFLNPGGTATPAGNVPATIINMAGCGLNATGQPVLGNGASPVPVRLITPQ